MSAVGQNSATHDPGSMLIADLRNSKLPLCELATVRLPSLSKSEFAIMQEHLRPMANFASLTHFRNFS
jgi:hypothetical protein